MHLATLRKVEEQSTVPATQKALFSHNLSVCVWVCAPRELLIRKPILKASMQYIFSVSQSVRPLQTRDTMLQASMCPQQRKRKHCLPFASSVPGRNRKHCPACTSCECLLK